MLLSAIASLQVIALYLIYLLDVREKVYEKDLQILFFALSFP